jgi:hypothetical protein
MQSHLAPLPLLHTVKNQLYTIGNPQFFDNFENMISHDSGSTVHGFSLAFLALDSFRTVASTNSLPFFPIIFAIYC